MERLDEKQVYRWFDIFKQNKELVEIRLIGTNKTASGYFTNATTLINAIKPFVDDYNIYFTINRVNDACYGREQKDKIVVRPKNTTQDSEIIVRDFVLLDLDAKRLTGTNATKEEAIKAYEKGKEIKEFLRNQGFQEPIIVFSSSGIHIYLRCALLPTEENNNMVKRFTQAMSMLFSDENVDVDEKVFNLGRISRLPGSYSCKGSRDSKERPQRMCRFLEVPSEIKVNEREYFQKIANMYPEDEVKPTRENNYSTEKFDLVSFMEKHGIKYRKQSVAGGTKYILDHCVFNEQHRGKDAAIFQRDNGAIAYVCFHNSCSQYTWKDVRLKFEPDAYDKKDYQEFQYKQRYYGNYAPKPFTPKKESEEIGKKWLSLSEVKLRSSDEYIALPTGYYALDKVLMGFLLGEVTLLSGNNGSGKTSWMDCVMLNIIDRGYKVAVWSGELPPTKMKEWIYQVAAGIPYTIKNPNFENVYDVDTIAESKIDKWIDGKLFLFNNDYGNRWEQILSDMNEIIETQGVQFIVCDNLMALDIDGKQGDKNDKQKQFILDVVNLAKKKDVHILIVAHPNKTAFNTLLRKESISGTSDLTNAVQRVMILHRVNEDFKKRSAEFFGKDKAERYFGFSNVLEICKDRSFGVQDFLFGMYYEPQTKRFKNTPDEAIHYGWENEPSQVNMNLGYGYDVEKEKDVDNGMPFQPYNGMEAPF